MPALSEKALWGIHAGRIGEADSLFLKQKVVALGWVKMGNLSSLSPDREAFKARIAQLYPEKKPGAVPIDAGQLYRFVHDMQVGDLIIYPSKLNRKVHIGKVEGKYTYVTKADEGYPHRRTVTWLKAVPRTNFSQGALYEIGSAMSFFQVKNYADEFRAVLEGKITPPTAGSDETIALVAEEIEETTRDFILKRIAEELKGHPFAEFIAHLLSTMGYQTRSSPEGPDGAIDILAHKDELGFEPPFIKVQVKSSQGNIGDPNLEKVYSRHYIWNQSQEKKCLNLNLP